MEDNGPANNTAPPNTNPAIGFPADADQIAGRINGVTAAGVLVAVSLPQNAGFTASLALGATSSQTINLLAASPGAVTAMGLSMAAARRSQPTRTTTRQHVAIIDTTTAATLGISAARLASHPAVFVNGIAYTVVGVYNSAQRVVTDEARC